MNYAVYWQTPDDEIGCIFYASLEEAKTKVKELMDLEDEESADRERNVNFDITLLQVVGEVKDTRFCDKRGRGGPWEASPAHAAQSERDEMRRTHTRWTKCRYCHRWECSCFKPVATDGPDDELKELRRALRAANEALKMAIEQRDRAMRIDALKGELKPEECP